MRPTLKLTAVRLAGLALLSLAPFAAGQQPPASPQPPTSRPADQAPAPQAGQAVRLVVRLPPEAQLEVDGVVTKQTGPTRYFRSPPVPPGKAYVYSLKATWTEKGKPVVREREVTVYPGREEEVDLRQEPSAKQDKTAKTQPKTPAKADTTRPPKKEETPKPPAAGKEETPKAPPPTTRKDESGKTATTTKKEEGGKPAAKTEEPARPREAPKLLVPYVPTPQDVVDKMLELAEVKKGDVVYDLGCGDGRIVVTAAKKFGVKAVGVDLDPNRVKESKENVQKAGVGNLVEIRQGDVLKTDVSGASVVALYLLPEVNLKLLPILKAQLKPGSRIVSHDFDMGDWKPLKKVEMMDKEEGRSHEIFLWKIEGGNK